MAARRSSLTDALRCPVTGRPLAFAESGSDWVPVPRKGRDAPAPIAAARVADALLLGEDASFAYPVVDGIPVLLGPERLVPSAVAPSLESIDLSTPEYREAYEEMAFYNDSADESSYDVIMGALALHRDQVSSVASTFPRPARLWVDATHESLTQLEAYAHLAPVRGKRALQIGGRGSHAVKMLLAGARSAILVTPMLSEARYAQGLATEWGVRDDFLAVVGIGEELPLADGSVDLAYSGGCYHHMRFDRLGAQLHRVLAAGGRFAGTDPFATLLHSVGTKLLGKREVSVNCRPITPLRIAKIRTYFPDVRASRHGPLLRYFFLGLEKLSRERFSPSVPAMMKVMRFDDFLGRIVGPLLGMRGGSVAICGAKQATGGGTGARAEAGSSA